ncbi:MAG: cytochrome c oxidase subunit II, partial [Acidobacteriota bacterium]
LGALFLFFKSRNKGSAKMGYSHNAFAPLALIGIPFFPEQASTFAWEVDLLYIVFVALTALLFLAIGGLEFYYAIKYRRRSANEVPEVVHESFLLEMSWIVIPFFLVMGFFVWGASLYFKLYRPPQEALEIFVTAKQWMWRAQHPDGQREINALHVPLGRRVKLTMTSEDVLHAYFVPAFRTKADVVPGRYTSLWFEPTQVGTFHLFCAEYCGTNHSGMIGWVTVLDPAAYQAWLSGGETSGSPVAAGTKLFTSLACNTCHKPDGQGRGPALEGLFGKEVPLDNGQKVIADEAYLRESILNPRARTVAGFEPIMPSFQGQVSEEQILQLVAYIKSIGPQQKQAPRDAGAPTAAKPGAAANAESTPKPKAN